jgi:hypothetical protein
LILFIVLIILYLIQWAYLLWRNKQQASKRVAMGKSASLVDKSMNKVIANPEEADDKHEIEQLEEHDNSLHDRTDFENEDFIYTY